MLPPVELSLPEVGAPKKALRQTEQRKAVFEALMETSDHPSAVDVFMRVKAKMPSISLATVKSHLVRVYAKLGVGSRSAALAVAVERGLLL